MERIADLARQVMKDSDEIDPVTLGFILAGGGLGVWAGMKVSVYIASRIKDAHALAAAAAVGSAFTGMVLLGVGAGLFGASLWKQHENEKKAHEWLSSVEEWSQMLEEAGLKTDAESLKRLRYCLKMKLISGGEFLKQVRQILNKYCGISEPN